MTAEEISYFSKLRITGGEGPGSWGDPSMIRFTLAAKVSVLETYLNGLGYRFHVTYGTQGQHDKNSEHYTGEAVDGVIIPLRQTLPKLSLLDQYFCVSRFTFSSIGLYRDWEYNGERVGGVHLGVRGEPHGKIWFCYKDENAVQRYVSLSQESLKKYGVI